MPAYHSVFNSETPNYQLIGDFPLLPLRTKVRGPAYTLPIDSSLQAHEAPEPDSESYDALDEVLSLFRANTFFRNFEIQGPPDRLLIYGILWVSECLGKVKPNMSAREAQKEVQNIALDSNFAIPGDPGFPLNQSDASGVGKQIVGTHLQHRRWKPKQVVVELYKEEVYWEELVRGGLY
ncbi:ARP2 3 complex p21-Arc subunit protein [Rutstroemia sp. NJR-2017a BBW]|nr:ARP2 3 complex p21-Arc subunit protein [Rutstroemia sp. NJR-2017a BBW]